VAEDDAARAQAAQTAAERDTDRAHATRRDFAAVLLHVMHCGRPVHGSSSHFRLLRAGDSKSNANHHGHGRGARASVDDHRAKRSSAEAVTVMKQLADSVLDLAKIEAGKMTVHLSSFDLRKWLASIASGFRLAASTKQLQFHVVESADLPVNVEQDHVRLRQVVTNLLSNAIKVSIVFLM
jgi:signal transduction histidine kinase